MQDFPDMLGYFVAMACPQCEDNLGRPFSKSIPGEGGFFKSRPEKRVLTDPIRLGDFVRLLGVFCLMDTKHFVRMTFNFGDRERTGSVLRDDIFYILFAMWPQACKGDRLTLKLSIEKYMKRFQVGTQVQPFVSFKHWKEMCKRFPRLVLPFKKLQYSWCTLFMGVKWWDRKKNDLEKARSKIKKDMGLEKRRKLAKEFLNEDGGGGDESTDEDDED